jgi:hypothetical protein
MEQYLVPPVPVGRLAVYDGATLEEFLAMIRSATENRVRRPIRFGSLAVVNEDWLEVSQAAGRTLPPIVDWRVSPGYQMNAGTQVDSDRRFLYFNLHGFPDQPSWKGFDAVRGHFTTAVEPSAFEERFVSGSIAFAENCYGAFVNGKTPQNSCGMRLLSQGAALIGATGLAFGSHVAPRLLLADADFLAREFFEAISIGVRNIGEALRQARREYFLDSTTPSTNPYKQKTLLQFTLLGDPAWN